MENGWKCSAGVQKLRQQNVLAKPLLELIWENTSAFGKKWVKTWRKREWCEALAVVVQSSSHGQEPVQDAAALGLLLGLAFKRYQIPAEVWLVQKNVKDHQCLV